MKGWHGVQITIENGMCDPVWNVWHNMEQQLVQTSSLMINLLPDSVKP